MTILIESKFVAFGTTNIPNGSQFVTFSVPIVEAVAPPPFAPKGFSIKIGINNYYAASSDKYWSANDRKFSFELVLSQR